ncbi:MAG: hypothetical protein HY318_02345 [Armatimonadetes bacterium]|nr:hypothetical protein [Armatimonadota bacterium]
MMDTPNPQIPKYATVTVAMFVRALVLGVAALVFTTMWMLRTELVNGRYISGGVPPMPALGTLLLLTLLSPILRRVHPKLGLSRAEILLVYSFLLVSVALLGAYMARAFLPHLTALFYFASPENKFRALWPHFPTWLTITDQELLRQCYEGQHHGKVPWAVWLRPLGFWMIFFVVLFFTVMCFITLVRRQWVERERLMFPLLSLPLQMTDGVDSPGSSTVAAFFRNPLMWLGFSIAAVHNLINIAHAFNTSLPALGFYYDVGRFFTERPLSSVQPLLFFFMPEAVGFGYFMSLEISFSVWFFYFLNKAVAVGATGIGYEKAGFPFLQEQSAGGYVALGLILVWRARHQLRDCLRRAFLNDRSVEDSREPLSYRVAVFGALAGSAFILLWMNAAGLPFALGIPYFVILLLFTLVYARIRAETGAPFEFLYPYGLPKAMILNATGTSAVVGLGGLNALTAFSAFAWLSRHHFMEMMGAYQLDNFQMGASVRVKPRVMTIMLILGVVAGLTCAFWCHLSAYYDYGQLNMEGNTAGDYRTHVAMLEYEETAKAVQTPLPADPSKTLASGAGFVVAALLVLLRTIWLQFPLHPLGYVMGTAYGSHTPFWGPFLTVWAVKGLILRLGGLGLYKRLMPVFLGLILGHYFLAGIVWPAWSLFIPEAVSRNYHLWFG